MTPEQAALLVKAKQSIDAARLLSTKEDLYCFSVSRAYYAMFYIAEAFLLGKELSYSKHGAVIAAFGEQFCKPAICPTHFHRYLIDAHRLRNTGDYDVLAAISLKEAEEKIEQAEEMLIFAQQGLESSNSKFD